MTAPARGACQRGLDGRLGAVQQVSQLERLAEVGVVAAPTVVDQQALGPLAQGSDLVAALGEQLRGAIHAALREHHLLELGAQDRGPLPLGRSAKSPLISRWTDASASGSGRGSGSSASSAAIRFPARRPKTRMSSREFVPSRFAPWTLTQATSPAA